MKRREFLTAGVALALLGGTARAASETREGVAAKVLATWYHLALELVRHTPTYTPPVASRTLAYMGVAAFEALASGDARLHSLVGQLNGLTTLPDRAAGQGYDAAVILNAVMEGLIHDLFSNTGPTGQHAMQTLTARLAQQAADGVAADVVAASRSYGATLAAAVLEWSRTDGGAVIENMGFPATYSLNPAPGHWVPTSKIVLQQAPLLPAWGTNRPFAMPAGDSCTIPAPTDYSEDPASAFYAEAMEVYATSQSLTDDQKQIARFWSDDAMLSYTPPGHWIAIMGQVALEKGLDLTAQVEALARMGVAMADAFIGCWQAKFRYDLIRPISYIKKVIDPKWEPLLNTPPFPEYPSGHSTQSAAAAAVLTALFGADYGFTDESPTPDGIPTRSFASFWAAADEAAISRLYGGIHFRPAIQNGQDQGRCIAAYAIALKTRV
ncbi:MAG: vanadium-dependent haloperoxidase [Pseudomonadota bacterium]